MRFTLIDRITELEPGKRIQARKSLSATEEYLRDHFPRFPIMPGVLMLEAMYQSAAWLVRATDDFQHSIVRLTEANNVKFSDFVQPGQTLCVTAELMKQEDSVYRLKCQGTVGDSIAVRGRLVLQANCLSDRDPQQAAVDRTIVHALRHKFRLLYPAEVALPPIA